MEKVFERKKKGQTEARDDVSLTEPDTSTVATDIPIRGRIRLSCDIDRHNHRLRHPVTGARGGNNMVGNGTRARICYG